jgi:hypothetical protein
MAQSQQESKGVIAGPISAPSPYPQFTQSFQADWTYFLHVLSESLSVLAFSVP